MKIYWLLLGKLNNGLAVSSFLTSHHGLTLMKWMTGLLRYWRMIEMCLMNFFEKTWTIHWRMLYLIGILLALTVSSLFLVMYVPCFIVGRVKSSVRLLWLVICGCSRLYTKSIWGYIKKPSPIRSFASSSTDWRWVSSLSGDLWFFSFPKAWILIFDTPFFLSSEEHARLCSHCPYSIWHNWIE